VDKKNVKIVNYLLVAIIVLIAGGGSAFVGGLIMGGFDDLRYANEELKQRLDRQENLRVVSLAAQKSRDIHLTTLSLLKQIVPGMEPILMQDISIGIAESHILYSNKGVTKELVLGIMSVESAFNPTATSIVGAKGLMQGMPASALPYLKYMMKEPNLENIEKALENPRTNIIVCSAIMSDYLFYAEQRYRGKVPHDKLINIALIAYNRGYGGLGKWIERLGGNPMDVLKVSKYDRKVLAQKSKYEKMNRIVAVE